MTISWAVKCDVISLKCSGGNAEADVKSHSAPLNCLALIHGQSTSTTSRLLRQTVIIDPRQIKSVVTSPAIWILEALFQFSENCFTEKKMGGKNEI